MGIVTVNSTPRQGHWALAIPKLRHGSHFPDWLAERRKRAEQALTTGVATCYLLGVLTRRAGSSLGRVVPIHGLPT